MQKKIGQIFKIWLFWLSLKWPWDDHDLCVVTLNLNDDLKQWHALHIESGGPGFAIPLNGVWLVV